MNVRKAVITAAGLGTRLLPATKELPKEMLPVFARGCNIGMRLKPLLQLLFEQVYRIGIREVCFIVGRGKRAIEDHFTPDWRFVDELIKRGKEAAALDLQEFYKMVESSHIVWINQPSPKGFGHAILLARPFVEDEPFMVLAGDTYIISEGNGHLHRFLHVFSKHRPDSVLLLQRVENPQIYGVAIVEEEETDVMRVTRVIEKPLKPPSNWAIMPHYIFTPYIIDILTRIKPGLGGEIQLTDAIQELIDDGCDVLAVALKNYEKKLDIGTPASYWKAIVDSYKMLLDS